MQFTIGRIMIVVALAALVLTPFAWLPQESRWRALITVLTIVTMLLIIASPFLLDLLESGKGVRHGKGALKPHPWSVAEDSTGVGWTTRRFLTVWEAFLVMAICALVLGIALIIFRMMA